MVTRQPLPLLWLLSDERNDARLERALAALPEGSGFVFRHYHLAEPARLERYRELLEIAEARGHTVIVGGKFDLVGLAGCDGVYGASSTLAGAGLRLATVHNAEERDAAENARVDGVFISPVYPTASHPDAATLGAVGFHMLAQGTSLPVIALGGMTAARAAELDWPRWGAIDGLS